MSNLNALVADTVRVQSDVVGSRSIELRYDKTSHREVKFRRHYLIIDGVWDGYHYSNYRKAADLYNDTVQYWRENDYATEEVVSE